MADAERTEPWTPGPWTVEFEVTPEGYTNLVWGQPEDPDIVAEGLTDPDARLISLAPEMAELLGRCFTTLDDLWALETSDYHDPILDDIRDLLARARGEG